MRIINSYIFVSTIFQNPCFTITDIHPASESEAGAVGGRAEVDPLLEPTVEEGKTDSTKPCV